MVNLRTFAIDPNSGYLFLTKYETKSRVSAALLRYSMDGTNMKSLLNDKLFYPNDLTLDVAMKKIYFLDHYFDFIQECDYEGLNRQFLQKLPLIKFHRITFFENMFYGAVNQNLSIIQISKSSLIFKKVLAENLEATPKMLKISHQQAQPVIARSKVCMEKNKCEHLCIPTSESTESSTTRIVEKCLCREGFKLENGKCKLRESKKFLMFTQDNPKTLKAIDIEASEEQVISPIIGLKSNIAFDTDLENKVIYFTSYSDGSREEKNMIEFQSFNGSNRGMLKGSFGTIQSMSYDWVGKNLYFTSQTPKTKISAVRLRAELEEPAMIKTLITKNIIGPCSLTLDPENGMFMFDLTLNSFYYSK